MRRVIITRSIKTGGGHVLLHALKTPAFKIYLLRTIVIFLHLLKLFLHNLRKYWSKAVQILWLFLTIYSCRLRLKTRVLDRLPEYPGHYFNYFWDTYSCSIETFDMANTFRKACPNLQQFSKNIFSWLQIIKLYNVAWPVATRLPGWAEVYTAVYTVLSRPCERFTVILRLSSFSS